MQNTHFPIEAQLEIERLQAHLQKHPEQAFQLAVKHFKDYLLILLEYEKLIQKHQSISFTPFPSPHQVQLEAEYEEQDTFCLF
ncbi:MAG: hypothetical protein QNJ60_12970 [Xenococcaceae cyanobacterium MO_188.B19]|nr:hypothetical protein [Xenococcaceae cyanobacterium MO_188.B19]